jgi:hypothetical protein
MNWNSKQTEAGEGTRLDAEETLRLVAELPPPEELTDRVHARLQAAQIAPSRRGFWSYWLPAQRFQFAAAAALALAVAGSTWAVYRQHPQPGPAAQTSHPASPSAASSSQPAGGFGTAGTVRVPPTLNPIKVPPAPHRKPGAGHAAAKTAPKPAAPPAQSATTPNP